jgi:ABC-type antimicrobial peptide transport system permease subunit
VARRTREIGVRMALGASRRQLFGMVLRDGMRPVLAGLALGLPAAAAAASVMRSLLFGIAPTDPAAYVATVAGLAAVAFVACVLPARRALRVEAMACLRDQ